ncbi:MAG: NUDIX domain-containing protein, partial [Rubrivivax sp.]
LPISPGAELIGAPDAALMQIADWLRVHGHAGRWRDEALAVVSTIDGTPLARVERGVARNLGLHTTAVQLHAQQAGTGRWWLQQRALDKATDPGLWDTLMGGLVSADESITQALQREAWEEAGVRLEHLPQPPEACGRFTVRRPVDDSGSHGYLMETVHAFACTLPAGAVPLNQDGEVLRFDAFTDAEIDTLVVQGQLTLEAAVAVALCRAPVLRA